VTTLHLFAKQAAGMYQPVTAFRRIVCGIDGNRAALEGARQAAALADPGGEIELVFVTNEFGFARKDLEPTPLRPDEALEQAEAELAGAPAKVATREVDTDGRWGWDTLLEAADDADVLVLGRHPTNPVEGVLIGGMTTYVLNHAELPVLAAVAPPHGLPFPGRILVAADGPGHPEDAVRLAAAIALRSGSDVVVLRVERKRRTARPEVDEAVAEIAEVTGTEPVEVVVAGEPHHVITEYAASECASLVITGNRGKTFVAGLHSVSERVAQRAPCSVLVIRGSNDPLRDLPYV
jgi:nucleotide-binding universal stress UspA family protein